MPRWVLAVVGVAALVGLFFLIRPDGEPTTATPAETSAPTETSDPSPTPEPTGTLDAVEIEVEEGRVEGPARITVTEGERVAIEVKADTIDQVHVHGYDLLADVSPEREVILTFLATIPGVFPIELEEAELLLTRLEVGP